MDVAAVGDRAGCSGRAATWRDPEQHILGTTDAATMCWFPRLAGALRATRDDCALVLPCTDCPGCRQFQKRQAESRLTAKYTDPSQKLFAVRVKLDPLRPPAGVRISARTRTAATRDVEAWISRFGRKLQRRRRLDLEPGLWRLGPYAFALLARSSSRIKRALARFGFAVEPESIQLSRGRRAWDPLTKGLLVSREQYGAHVNRFYARGLPAREKLSWNVIRIPFEKGYDWTSSPRAWTANGRVLVPPEVWKQHSANRRKLRGLVDTPASPELAQGMSELISKVAGSLQIPFNRGAEGALPVEVVKQHYAEMARRVELREAAARAATDQNLDSPPWERRYITSERSSESEHIKLLSDEDLARAGPSGKPVWAERELADKERRRQAEAEKRAANQKYFAEWAERMKAKVKGRNKDGT